MRTLTEKSIREFDLDTDYVLICVITSVLSLFCYCLRRALPLALLVLLALFRR